MLQYLFGAGYARREMAMVFAVMCQTRGHLADTCASAYHTLFPPRQLPFPDDLLKDSIPR